MVGDRFCLTVWVILNCFIHGGTTVVNKLIKILVKCFHAYDPRLVTCMTHWETAATLEPLMRSSVT